MTEERSSLSPKNPERREAAPGNGEIRISRVYLDRNGRDQADVLRFLSAYGLKYKEDYTTYFTMHSIELTLVSDLAIKANWEEVKIAWKLKFCLADCHSLYAR